MHTWGGEAVLMCVCVCRGGRQLQLETLAISDSPEEPACSGKNIPLETGGLLSVFHLFSH